MKSIAHTLKKVSKYIEQHRLFEKNQTILCAMSGGVDSMVMADILIQLQYNIAVAHCNFKLRGKSADKDEAFVKKYAEKYQLKFYTTSFETTEYAKEKGISIQMAARELRYKWFEKIRIEQKNEVVATAHHLNDNAETILLNLIKGTGIQGISGIMPINNKIVRPILCLSKKEIEHYAAARKIKYREDVSNQENKYERNFLRNIIFPKLEKINPQVIQTFAENTQHFTDAKWIFDYGLQKLLKKLAENRKGNIYISIAKLIQMPGWNTLLYHFLQSYQFTSSQMPDILQLTTATSGKQVSNKQYRIIRSNGFLIITPLPDEQNTNIFISIKNEKQVIKTPHFTLKFQLKKFKGIQNKNISWFAQLDASTIQFPLTLRLWKPGDYFYPLGFNKKKKISNFLIDEKVPIPEKESTYVLLSEEKIIAILGRRIDHRFKTDAQTKRVLEVKMIKK